MPTNQFQRTVFALLTVIVTVHAFVFYNFYVVSGDILMQVNGTQSVMEAITKQGGIYLLGMNVPIWAVVAVEFVLAFSLEMLVGSPCSFKLACKVFNPKETHPVLFESAFICATVGIMCPAMSLLAAFLYYPYYAGFDIITLFCNWFELVCVNLPFAFFGQLLFIQPLIRKTFKTIFRKQLAKQA